MGVDIGTITGTIALQDKFSAGIDHAAKGLDVFTRSFSAVAGLAAGVAAGIGAAGAALVQLGQRGAQVADVSDSFKGLSAAAGSSADMMLGALQKGTLGTISNFDLMSKANGVLSTGLVKNAGDMGTLAAGAKLLADRTGGDTAEAFDKLTGAISSGRTASLKQLGLFVDSGVAAEDYARSLGKSVGDLTDHENATALSAAAMTALKQQLQEAGPAAEDFGDFIDQGKTAVKNFTDNLALAVATSPVVMAGMKGIRDAVQSAFGGSQQDTVKLLMGYVNQFAIFVVDAAQVAVKAAQFISNAWSGVKVIFNLVLETLASGFAKFADAQADLLEKAAALPIIGSQFKEAAVAVRGMADTASSLALGFGELKDAALDSAASQNAAFNTAHAALGKVGDAMRAANGAAVEMTAGAEGAAGGLKKVEEGARLSAAQIKAMEDATRKGQEAMFDSAERMAVTFETLQQELTLANMTGLERRLADIEIARQKEIAGLQSVAFEYPAMYEQLVVLAGEKYEQMTLAAQGHFGSVLLAAEAAGFKTREQMELTATTAATTYQQMLTSGEFTFGELQKAHEAAMAATMALDAAAHGTKMGQLEEVAARTKKFYDDLVGAHKASQKDIDTANKIADDADKAMKKASLDAAIGHGLQIAAATSSILRDIFGKNKTAAIAAALIDTAAAIVKSLASMPMPWALVPAAAAAAAGYAQVAAIRAQQLGFREGTSGTAFEDFGRGSLEMLHGREAVVTQAQGASLAEMVGNAIRDARGGGDGSGSVPIQLTVILPEGPIIRTVLNASRRGVNVVNVDGIQGHR